MWGVLLDSFLDALKLLPFLFVLYILIEVLEHKTAVGKPARALSGKWAPLIGGAAGLIPLCGFSVMASKLYRRKFLTLGTLIAVFIATSDEALLVLALSSLPVLEKLFTILALLGSKLVLAAGAGYLVDLIAGKRGGNMSLPALETEEADECTHAHGTEHAEEHEHEEGREEEHGHGTEELSVCEHRHESKWTLFLFSPLWHALQVAAFVFAFNFLFAALFHAMGEERVIGFLQGAGKWYQPLVTSFVALIPNCASSVALAEVYAIGGIGFSSLLGGLVTNAGLGIFVLFRDFKKWRESLAILIAMFALGVAVGYIASAIELMI